MANNLKHNTTTKNAYVHYTVPEPPTPGHTTSRGPPKHPPPGGSYWDRFDPVTAAIAEGKRPAPFRTRKLSPPAPMVLHPPGCGRVGHRRTPTRLRPAAHGSRPEPFPGAVSWPAVLLPTRSRNDMASDNEFPEDPRPERSDGGRPRRNEDRPYQARPAREQGGYQRRDDDRPRRSYEGDRPRRSDSGERGYQRRDDDRPRRSMRVTGRADPIRVSGGISGGMMTGRGVPMRG